jgi:CopG family nickel-responsive transcriptional regulator
VAQGAVLSARPLVVAVIPFGADGGCMRHPGSRQRRREVPAGRAIFRLAEGSSTMERITISLEAELAGAFDQWLAQRGYQNRSEAVRDLIRAQIAEARNAQPGDRHCVANLSYVYNHHERDLAERLTALQHDHHDLTVATMHAHLDHDHCLESAILKGPAAAVQRFADALVAERGVRHGLLNLVTVEVQNAVHSHGGGKPHSHARGKGALRHFHYRPKP